MLAAVEIGDRQQVLHSLAPRLVGRTPELDAVRASFDRPAVDLDEPHPDVLGELGRQVLADEVGPDRQLAVTAVDEHRELHRARPAQLGERVERGADRAPV